jgi:hypothetical protein
MLIHQVTGNLVHLCRLVQGTTYEKDVSHARSNIFEKCNEWILSPGQQQINGLFKYPRVYGKA